MFRTPRPTTHVLSTATTVLRLTCWTDCVRSFAQGSEPFADRGGVVGRAALDCWADLSVWLAEESRMASRVLVKKIKMRVPAGKATAAPPVGPALGARTRHRRSESDAEQFDSFDGCYNTTFDGSIDTNRSEGLCDRI